MSTATDGGDEGFFTFYREYAHTGLHTITATALTAFGLLTFVHRGFVVLAIAVYVLPPVYLYLTRDGEPPEPVDEEAGEPSSAAEPTTGDTDADASSTIETNERLDDQETATSGGTTADSGAIDRAPGTGAGSGPGNDEPANPSGAEADRREGPGEESGSAPAAEAGAAERSEAGSDATPESPSEGSESDGAVEDEGGVAGVDDDEKDVVDESGPAEWGAADSLTDETLLDAVSAGEDAYAAGENGILLARSGDEEWELALESGPAAESTTLQGVDATEDGEAVWVAGDGGVLGRYDSTTARHTDHSAPEGITDNWSGLAVTGVAGGERVALVNGSGQVLFGEYDGSEVEWDEPIKPGSGSSMSAIEFVDESLGYCCDTNAGVYRIEGREFERIGIENASGFDALAAADDAVAVASDDGTVQRFDGSVWTPVRVAEVALNSLAADGEEWFAVGAGGVIHANADGDWEAVDSPTDAELFGVTAGDVPVAVGADGTVVERR